jgi:hypothetical protein
MFSKISKKVSVPIGLPITERKSVYTVPSRMQENRVWAIDNFPFFVAKTATEVNVFKPDRKEGLIEAIDCLPRLALYR